MRGLSNAAPPGDAKFSVRSVPDIVFRRPQAAPIGGSFEAAGIDRHRLVCRRRWLRPRASSVLNDHFRLFVGALAEMMMADAPLRIDEIQRRPIVVAEGAPDDIVVVDARPGNRPACPSRPSGRCSDSFQTRTPARARRSPPIPGPCISRPRRAHREACAAS